MQRREVDLPKADQDYFKGQRSDVADLVPGNCARFLDAGCGYGGLGRNLRAHGVQRVFGVEINPDVASQLAEVYADYWMGDVGQVNHLADIEAFGCFTMVKH